MIGTRRCASHFHKVARPADAAHNAVAVDILRLEMSAGRYQLSPGRRAADHARRRPALVAGGRRPAARPGPPAPSYLGRRTTRRPHARSLLATLSSPGRSHPVASRLPPAAAASSVIRPSHQDWRLPDEARLPPSRGTTSRRRRFFQVDDRVPRRAPRISNMNHWESANLVQARPTSLDQHLVLLLDKATFDAEAGVHEVRDVVLARIFPDAVKDDAHAIDAMMSCVCSMAWSFHVVAVTATTHWLISIDGRLRSVEPRAPLPRSG